jgi:hypothetical protein
MSGNALHRLIAFTHPHVKHVVTHSIHAAIDEEGTNTSCLQDEQFVHLRRQVVRISQGKEVEQFSTLSPENEMKPKTQKLSSTQSLAY